MALSTAVISYDIADMVGADFDARRTKVWVTTNVDGGTVVDTVGNQIRIGDGLGTIAENGTGSVSVWVPGAGSNPASWQTYVHIDFSERRPAAAGGKREVRDFGPFTVTANADLADLVAEQEVPPTYLSTVTGLLDGYVDDAQAAQAAAAASAAAAQALVLSDLGTTDGQTKALIQNPASQTAVALAGTFASRRVHVILAAGQSNMSGRGADYSTAKDPANGRIKQWNPTTGTFIAATEPLLMHDTPTGIGPALQFARNMLERVGPLDLIYIVGTAHGGTGLSTDETPLGWRWGVTGNLSAQAVTKTQAALVAAVAANPGVPVNLAAMLWFQGETDSTTTAMVPLGTYRTDLDALIAGFRSTFAAYLRDAILPVIVYRMIPEALGSGTRDQVDAVHQNTPYRLANVGVVPSIAGQSNGDNLHANAAQHRTNGPVAFAEFQRILSGRAPVYPDAAFTSQVTGLVASLPSNGTSVGLSWTASANATSYLIEYKASASSTWLTGPAGAGTTGTVTGLTTGTAYDFRVTASNALGSVAPSATTSASPATTPSGTSIFADNFNRADAAVLGSTSTGSLPWQVVGTGGSGLIASNRGGVTNTGASRTIAFVNTAYADCVYKATLAVKDSGIESLVFRYADVNNNLFLSRESGSSIKWALWKRVGGTATLVQASAVSITAADQIEATLNGSSVVVKVNGATAITTTLTDLVTATGYGFGSITTYAARWDDISAVTV